MKNKDLDVNFHLAIEKAIASLDFPQDIQHLSEIIQTKDNLTNTDKESLYQLKERLQKIIPNSMTADIEGDRIIVHFIDSTTEPIDTPTDYTPFMRAIMEYMESKGMNVKPFPKITLQEDLEEGKKILGKTAYYDPELEEIVLYTSNRHPKDILRSFAHEMIHHIQKQEGRIGNGEVSTTNINEDEHLRKLEEEAYLKGNIAFREWTDKTTKA